MMKTRIFIWEHILGLMRKICEKVERLINSKKILEKKGNQNVIFYEFRENIFFNRKFRKTIRPRSPSHFKSLANLLNTYLHHCKTKLYDPRETKKKVVSLSTFQEQS